MSIDLTTRYLGIQLLGPLAVSACPLTGSTDDLRRLEAEGASAAVLPSLFEEQLGREGMVGARFLDFGSASPEAADYFPELRTYNGGADRYLHAVEEAKQAVRIPVFASLNGCAKGGWTRYATLLEGAGADAIELGIHSVPLDPSASALDLEARYAELVSSVVETVHIPVAVKIGPHFTAPLHFARRLAAAGAGALVLFHRVLPPDLDLDQREVVAKPSFSDPREMGIRLQWTGILRDRVPCDLAATGGVHGGEDVLKLLLAGSDLVFVASALYGEGAPRIRGMLDELRRRMEETGAHSVEQVKGSLSWQSCGQAGRYGREGYLRALVSYGGESVA